MKLFFSPGACSFVPHVALQLLGVDFEPVMLKLHKGEHQSEEFLALNPRGQVPVLVHGDAVITQIVAQLQYLEALHPHAGVWPGGALARAQAFEKLAWLNNTVHPTFTHVFMPHKFSDVPAVQVDIKAHAVARYTALMQDLQTMVANLPDGAWLAGAHISPLDAYALTVTRWSSMAGIDPVTLPLLWRYVERVAQQPAVSAVIERERLQLNMYKPTA